MRIYPAIDLMAGKCVRLNQGCFSSKKIYSSSPVNTAKKFVKDSSQFLHLVDLDGAKQGNMQQLTLIKKILAISDLKVQVGGGIKNQSTVDQLLNAGADRVIIGTLTVTDPEQVVKWLQEYGPDKIVLAFDVRFINELPVIATSGWQSNSAVSLWQLLKFYSPYARHYLCTDISSDGRLQGPNIDLYDQWQQQFPNLACLVSGGIRSINDVQRCAKLSNVEGVIVGTAVYENKINLAELSC
jgi:phosphoribosylformimino-5-aminoimidazole carboxamide ribotide isomerase